MECQFVCETTSLIIYPAFKMRLYTCGIWLSLFTLCRVKENTGAVFYYSLSITCFWHQNFGIEFLTVNQQKITNNWRKVCLQNCLYVCNLADVAAGMAGLKTSVYDQVAFQRHFVDISVQKLKDSLIIWEDKLYRRLLQWVQVTSVPQMAHDTTKSGDQSRPLRLRWILHRAQPYVRPNWTLWQAAGFCMLHIKKLKEIDLQVCSMYYLIA